MTRVGPGGGGMMSPRRFAIFAGMCATVVLTGWAVAGLGGLDSSDVANTDAAPVPSREATSNAADTEPVNASQVTVIAKVNSPGSIVAMAAPAAPEPAVVPAAVPVAEAASAETARPVPSPNLLRETEPVQIATANPSAPVQSDPLQSDPVESDPAQAAPVQNQVQSAASSMEVLDECLEAEVCIDRYLWVVYQRTPKRDTIKQTERRKVTVKKGGKTRTVTKSFTKLVDEDFTWKDPKAAERAGMSMQDYVIGGMDRGFKVKLFRALCALDDAGLMPGITSGFRDDYRQSIASGLKAASDRSFHGGSSRGGYGHGLAADVVSVKGATRVQRWVSTESLWKWIDANGKDYGVGRPYLDRDPPHVTPVDSREYVARRSGASAKHAKSVQKKHNRVAARDGHNVAKRPITAKASKVRVSARTSP